MADSNGKAIEGMVDGLIKKGETVRDRQNFF